MLAQSEQEKGRLISPSRLPHDPLSPYAPLFLATTPANARHFSYPTQPKLVLSLSIPETSLSLSLYLAISLFPQGTAVLRSPCFGHPLETPVGERSSRGADWLRCSSVEANSRQWRRVQWAWPRRGFLALYLLSPTSPTIYSRS